MESDWRMYSGVCEGSSLKAATTPRLYHRGRKLLQPRRLRIGSRVAIVAPSSGLAVEMPGVFEKGLENLRSLGLEPVVFPTVKMTTEELYASPQARANDIHGALTDENIDGIVSAIGGYDSIRLLPLLDFALIRAHPKVIIGGSDATTYLSLCRALGVVTFYGPSVMSGFAQMHHLPAEFREHLRRFLLETWDRYTYSPYPKFTHGYTGWAKTGSGGVQALQSNTGGWRVLQGSNQVAGHLWGGCIEVLEFLKATAFWPPLDFFDDAVLFFETSEEKPPPTRVGYMLRNYGVAGILGRAAAVLVGRPKDYSDPEKKKLEEELVRIIAGEFGLEKLPVIVDVDLGHTDPKLLMPIGGTIQVDSLSGELTLLEWPFME